MFLSRSEVWKERIGSQEQQKYHDFLHLLYHFAYTRVSMSISYAFEIKPDVLFAIYLKFTDRSPYLMSNVFYIYIL